MGDRRDFLARAAALSVLVSAGVGATAAEALKPPQAPTFMDYLRGSAVPKRFIDSFLQGPGWARFDPEIGYVLGNSLPHDGVDGSSTISTAQPNGARTSFLYRDRKPRINSYGNSFTQGHQVSDGETWQEYLAAHLGEPIGNFGMGGHGVYQAYRRLLREERSDHGAEFLIFYIWGDDPIRSLYRARWATNYPRYLKVHDDGLGFHGNFWSNMEMDLAAGRIMEREQLLTTPQSLYRMTDSAWMLEHLRDDLALQLTLYSAGVIGDLDRRAISRLAEALEFKFDWSLASRGGTVPGPFPTKPPVTALQAHASDLLDRYSFAATQQIIDKLKHSARTQGKKLLVLLFDPYRAMQQLHQGLPRYDQPLIDHLRRSEVRFFDMNEVHIEDFKAYRLSWQDYMNRYFIGHYTPSGQHFFAHAIKDTVVDWLHPKPLPYQSRDQQKISFEGYLRGL